MPTHIEHPEKSTYYFVTFTCYKWLPLFEKSGLHEYFPSWFKNMEKQGGQLTGFVVMPNHLHMVVFVKEKSKGLNHIIGNAKRFLSYEIVKRLKKRNELKLLEILKSGVQDNERKSGKIHQIFRLSFDAKELRGDKEITSVLDYIHHNPVKGKWNLAEDFVNYQYSSALFYEEGKQREIEVTHYSEVSFPSESSVE